MVILYLILLCIFLSYDLFITNMYIYIYISATSHGIKWLVAGCYKDGVCSFFLKEKGNVNVFSIKKK